MLATGGGREGHLKKFSGHTKNFCGHITFFPENDKKFPDVLKNFPEILIYIFFTENHKIFPDISKLYPKITEFFRKYQNTKTNPIVNQRPLGKECNLNDIFHGGIKGTLLPEKGHFWKVGGEGTCPQCPPFLRHWYVILYAKNYALNDRIRSMKARRLNPSRTCVA